VFRDSRGVVHTVCSADPLADLPPGAAVALQRALLEPDPDEPVDLGGALERCDAVLELVERWQDAFFTSLPDDVDLEEEARYAAEAGLSLEDVESGYAEDEDEDEDDGAYEGDDEVGYDRSGIVLDTSGSDGSELDPDLLLHLPEELVTVLERELLLLPLRVRLEALVAAANLVGEWSDLIADPEKLLGHLVLAHEEPQARTGHEELVRRHGSLHGSAGPAHLAGSS
jgi:hypothetical protein